MTASLFSTLDGVVEAPDEWQFSFDDEMRAAMSRMLDELDTVLLGRVSYTEWGRKLADVDRRAVRQLDQPHAQVRRL